MHGLAISAVRRFVVTAYGKVVWNRVCVDAGISGSRFQSVLPYDVSLVDRLLCALQSDLAVPREAIMEDIGTSIVTQWDAVRRLLRFGGATYIDFLYSLEDLPGRARLAVPELDLPDMALHDMGDGRLKLSCAAPLQDLGHALCGLLRAVADDYGALVTIEYDGHHFGFEAVTIKVHDIAFTSGARFSLADGVVP